MDKHLQFHVRAFLADFLDFIQAQFAREDDAAETDAAPELDCSEVGGAGLNRQVNWNLRPFFAHHHDQAGVGHDQRIRLHFDHRFHIGQIGLDLGVVRQNVAGNKKQLVARVRFFNALAQLLQLELIVARTQAVTRLAGINGVGAIVVGGAHFLQIAGRQQ